MRTITLIVVHCSGSSPDHRYTFEQCRRDHVLRNHWKDIGYHWYIELDGSVHQGRPEEMVGAHCRNHNLHSIGVCYEGGVTPRSMREYHPSQPADTRNPAQKLALRRLLTDLHQRYPRAIIVGHRDLSPDLNHDGFVTPEEYVKQCPCFDTIVEYSDLQPSF